jgi:hypothetical protein
MQPVEVSSCKRFLALTGITPHSSREVFFQARQRVGLKAPQLIRRHQSARMSGQPPSAQRGRGSIHYIGMIFARVLLSFVPCHLGRRISLILKWSRVSDLNRRAVGQGK